MQLELRFFLQDYELLKEYHSLNEGTKEKENNLIMIFIYLIVSGIIYVYFKNK